MERPAPTAHDAAPTGPAVLVRSAVPLTDAQRTTLQALCVSRYGALGPLTFELDPAIIGGVWLRVGDMVIDGSLTGRIEQLRHSLRDHLHAAASSDRASAP